MITERNVRFVLEKAFFSMRRALAAVGTPQHAELLKWATEDVDTANYVRRRFVEQERKSVIKSDTPDS